MANEVLNMEQWGINERGEIVAVTGIGSNNVTGYVDVSQRPVDKSGKTVFANVPTFAYDSYGNFVGLQVAGNVVPLGGFTSVLLTLNSPAAATANAAALNAALATGGTVVVPGTGTAYINNTLVIRDNTHLSVSDGLEIKLADNTAKAMLIPAAFQNYLSPLTVAAAWTAGSQLTLTWAGHGLTVEDYVWLQGAAETQYTGVFKVINVIDANTVKVLLHRTPTVAPTGTVKAIRCTRNFRISGGVWNGNYPTQNTTGTPSWQWCIFSIMAAANFTVENVVLKEPALRGMTVGAVADYVIENCTATQSTTFPMEGFKTFGPSANGTIRNCVGRTSDDVASVQPSESAAFGWPSMPRGDILGLLMEKNDFVSFGGGTAGAIPVYLTTDYMVDDLTVRNNTLWAQQGCGFWVGRNDDVLNTATVKGGLMTLSGNNYGTGQPAAKYPLSIAANVDVLRIDSPRFMIEDTTRPIFNINDNAVIKTLEISNWDFIAPTYPTDYINPFQVLGTVDTLIFKGSNIQCNPNFAIFGMIGGTCRTMILDTTSFSGCIDAFRASGTLNNLIIRGGRYKDMNSIFSPQSITTPTNVTLDAAYIDNMNVGAINPAVGNGIVCHIYGGGNTINSGVLINATAPAKFVMHTPNIPVDVGQAGAVKTVSGQFAFNTVARGTLAANRLVTCNGTNWIQIDTPANVF